MRVILVLLLFFVFESSFSHGKEKILFCYKEPVELKIPTSEQITYCAFGKEFYYCKKYFDSSDHRAQLKIYSYNLENKNSDSVIISLPLTESIMSWSVSSMAVNDKVLVIKSDSLYIFGTDRKLLKVADNYKCDYVSIIDRQRLLLYKNYNSHPLDDSVKTRIVIYNFKRNKIEKEIEPDFRYILYTHFVNNFFSYSSNKLAFAQTIPYKIDFFSTANLTVTDSIVGANLSNTNSILENIENVHKEATVKLDPKRHFYKLKPIDSLVNRIEKVLFLNDSTLLVSKRFPNANFEKRIIDVWVNREDGWSRVVSDQLYQTEKSDKDNYLITPLSLPLDLTYSNQLIANGSEILLVDRMAPPAMNINSNGLKTYYDEFYSTHELNYFLWIYHWDLK